MSQRNSEYKRIPNDLYSTPDWVTEALLPHLPKRVLDIWEPAAGPGKMVAVLRKAGMNVRATDITTGTDFASGGYNTMRWVVTNPPFLHAQKFIEGALKATRVAQTGVAMLLRIDYDSAKTRRHLFADHPAFCKKVVLLKRIRWIEGSTGSPSENHCWLIWDWQHKGPPTIGYAL